MQTLAGTPETAILQEPLIQEQFFYSPSTQGFYHSGVHSPEYIPEDVIEIDAKLHQELIDGQSAGKRIMPPDAEHDLPYLADPPPPTAEESAAWARSERDRLLAETDYLIMPDYPLSDEQRSAVQEYRQALRDVPKQEGFPHDIQWPEMM